MAMKILHIISSGGMYGAEAVILNLSRSLNRSTHSSVLGVFSNSSNPNLELHEAATREGIESHLIPCRGQVDHTIFAKIQTLVERTQADLVHTHGYKADIYSFLALRESDVPLVSTCHTWYDNDVLVSLYGAADRFVLRRFAAVASVSADVTRRLLRSGVAKQKIHVVRNGIDLKPFDAAVPSLRNENQVSADGLTVGLVGRLAREKGIDIFVRAAARVIEQFPSSNFVIVGDGPDRRQLEVLISELKLGENVILLGQRDDMPSVYASFDIMVSSSRQEGLPIALLEGMASRLPIIATSVGEVPVAIRDQTGVLISPENEELLARSIISLLSDRTMRQRLGLAARQLVEQEFSSSRMMTDYLQIYEEAIATRHSGANRVDRQKAFQV